MNIQTNIVNHYFQITFRNILKYKTRSFTAIFGLAFSLLCFVPALCWMHYETSYDSFYPDAGHIYRIYSIEKQSGKVNEQVPGILGRELLKQFPAMDASTGFVMEQLDYTTEEMTYIQLNTICVDSAFFRVFPQESVCGDMRQALQIAGNMVLAETAALRLFGNVEKAIGQQVENSLSRIFGTCTVTAVIKDPPSNTNLPFDAILNFPALQDASMIMSDAEQWNYFNNYMYVKFHPQANINELATQLCDFTSQIKTGSNIELRILPISNVRHRLDSDLPFTLNFIRLLVVAGILLVFSALFNFLNLHLGLFRQRIHEFRQRMIHGATGRQLILQMMFELSCTVLVALLLGCCFVLLTRPVFSGLLGVVMPMSLLLYFFVFCGSGMMILILSISFIPCWRLNRSIMKSLSERKTTRHVVLQRMAVSFQLAVSIIFIVAALVIMRQMHFVNRKNLGFDQRGIIQLYSANMKLDNHQAALKRQLEAIPQIINISVTAFKPEQNANAHLMTAEVEWSGKQPHEKPVFQWIFADNRFVETFRLKLLKGKWWGEGESRKIVLNEEAVRVMELREPIGAIIRMDPFLISSDGVAPMQEYEVVGVVNDFHSLSLRSRIHPTIFRTGLENIWYIRVVPGQEREVIQRISAILPDIDISLTDIRLTLLDELYNRLNYSEQTGLKLFSVLAAVCLSISLFGIYAVTTAATQRRRKEIAVRKIVGAEVKDIIRMFFREYTIQVIIAGAVALPLAYYAMHRWLQGYAYRTNIPWWLLVVVLAGVIAVVLLTMSGQVLKAANSNPSEVVKSN
ncbi:MAG: ABC transporter permease [Tannerella sp.]|jgi:ABC-type antimicrobial peptide transport system permease subunit|nr:ABC transporter permease [Tannerella sp.]